MKKLLYGLISSLFLLSVVASDALASHSWGNYHWARIANPFTLKFGDNLSSAWKPYLATTTNDWNQSSVLEAQTEAGQSGKNCSSTTGRVEVCNKKYGNNGWLGIAQIWVSGDHITKGVVKVNDTYFNTAKYNKPEWRNLVMCQEVGHTLGLDHQDEKFDNPNLGSCMDYTSNPDSNQHPNTHDYEQLEVIYSHLDSFSTIGALAVKNFGQYLTENLENPNEWGQKIKDNGAIAEYERRLPTGLKLHTFVIWAN